jgi:ribosomal-protein-alanine N-acetyltransferase
VHWPEQNYQAAFQPGAPERHLWVIEDRGQLQAFLIARFSAAECEVENLVVAKQHRRRGLALELMQALIAVARQRNLERVLLEVRESNEAARAFYEKVGFQENGRRKAYYTQPREDAILLALTLNCTFANAPNR